MRPFSGKLIIAAPIVAVATIFALAMLFPWDDFACDRTCGQSADPQIFALLAVVLIIGVTSLLIGVASNRVLPTAAAFVLAAVFAYVLGNTIDYEMAWRGVSWNSGGETSRLVNSRSDAMTAVFVGSVVGMPIGIILAMFGFLVARVFGRKPRLV